MMANQASYLQLVQAVTLTKIQYLETSSLRLGEPLPETPLQYNIQQMLGDANPERISDSVLLFRVKFDIQIRSGEASPFCSLSAAYAVLFELKDAKTFNELWPDSTLQTIFQNEQLRKTLWPYVRQFMQENLVRLELPAITLPWLV